MRKDAYFVTIIIGVFLNVQCFSESTRTTSIGSPPPELKRDAFYTKYLDCDGIAVVGSDRVDDRAFYRLQELLDKMFTNRPDLREAMFNEGFGCIIIAEEEQVTDVPEYADMEPKDYWNQRARGFGGQKTSCGEENLLNLPLDRYAGESIFIHELAHGIHLSGLVKCDPTFQTKLDTLYKQAMEKGLYENDYAATNPAEYWAESVQAFYDCDRENDKVHNHVNTREELMAYDPNMAALVQEVFRINEESDWRYERYSQKLIVEKTPAQLNHNGLLPKHVWCLGFPVLGTESTPDELLLAAAATVQEIFEQRYDILKAMIDAGVCVVICEPDADVSEFDQSCIVMSLSEDEQARIDQSKLVYDLVCAAYRVAGMRPVESVKQPVSAKASIAELFMDIRFDQKAQILYDAAINKGLWDSGQGVKDRFEYIARGSVAFFDAGTLTIGEGRNISDRKELAGYDPELVNLLEEVFLPLQKKH